MTDAYNPVTIEQKWRARWAADNLYRVPDRSPKPKWYALTMFPYTSGDLHIGHWYAMAPSDVHARFKRMQGYNVLHPMGFDAFGLPAENAAIKRGIHPRDWTMKNVENMRRQLRTLGAVYDWEREVVTCLPDYYKWTQWFFLKFYQAGLAYRAKAAVSWCPKCQTVLANEQVVGEGVCDRCETPVVKKDLAQWFLRITRYADELLRMDDIDWPERIKLMQANWIGRSTGADITFPLEKPAGNETGIKIFTTRPDTLFGVTFMVLAPEHPLVTRLTTPAQQAEVEAYVDQARRRTEMERATAEREKTGVFLGSYATNPANGEKVPVWIADYVLPTYGYGAVMAVPAHDTRDFAFATRFKLPVPVVISPPAWDGQPLKEAWTDEGTMVNSGPFNGLPSLEALKRLTEGGWLEKQGWGKAAVTYRLRDWLVSRQRYWGAPIPVLYCEKCGTVPVPEKDLPVLLPPDADFKPTGESPLKYVPSFVNATCPQCGGPAKRETDTMDTHMCSAWYHYRYTSPGWTEGAFDPARVKAWMPVDLYTGGAEHAVMHLLYARFFTKALRDLGLISFGEPFHKLFNQGTVIYQKAKMSKSKGNVVNPDEYVNSLGADTVRVYIMFVGPWEQGGEWIDNGIIGMNRWLHRVWSIAAEPYAEKALDDKAEKNLRQLTHRTIRKCTADLERFHFNTMLAALMEMTNALADFRTAGSVSATAWKEAADALVLLIAPSAPHLAEELRERRGGAYSVHNQPWPAWDPELAREDEITLVLQVNGKLRDKVSAPAGIGEAEAVRLAQDNPKLKPHLEGKRIIKQIYVPGRLVNIVVG
jgi:leucyl-tRNA synthetase